MRSGLISMAAMLAWVIAAPVHAQAGAAPVLSAMETAVACAPPPTTEAPPNPLRIIGAQDTSPRALFTQRDLLVIGGGTSEGLQLGQEFFVRRPNRFGSRADRPWQGVRTLGWIRVVAVNETTAIAAVDHGCSGISQGDYLELFATPVVPAEAEQDMVAGDPDFGA